MRIPIQDNSHARKLQIRLLNTDKSSPIYNSVLERYTKALEQLPKEGKMVARNGFLIPWKSK